MTAEFEPTKEQRDTVSLHAMVGTRQELIAKVLGIDPKTLRKHFRDELDTSLAVANAEIGGTLFNKAKKGDTAAAIFWLKTRAGLRETNRTELTGADGEPVQVNHGDLLKGVNKKLVDALAKKLTE